MNDISNGPTIDLLKTGLQALGYTHDSFKLENIRFTKFTSPTGQVWLTEDNRIAYPFNSTTARRISTQKNLGYILAQKIGVEVPYTKAISKNDDSSELFEDMLHHVPLIVKPNAASLSNGLTLNVRSSEELLQALETARAHSDLVLVQNQLDGEEIRFVIVGHKVTAAILRQTPRVIGDGVSTLQTLLENENQAREAISMPYLKYPKLKSPVIDLTNFDLQSVPAQGEIVELGRGTMIAKGASMYNVLDKVHPSYIEVAEKLAAELGSGFMAVDIFIHDYTEPLEAGNYAFIEYNTSPVLKVFYSCRDGMQYDVLSDLIPFIDRNINGGTL